MRRKKSSSKPKAPKRAKIKVTSSCADKGLLIVFSIMDKRHDYGMGESHDISVDHIAAALKSKKHGIILDDYQDVRICGSAEEAKVLAEKNAQAQINTYIAHIVTVTEQKLEKWPGAGC